MARPRRAPRIHYSTRLVVILMIVGIMGRQPAHALPIAGGGLGEYLAIPFTYRTRGVAVRSDGAIFVTDGTTIFMLDAVAKTVTPVASAPVERLVFANDGRLLGSSPSAHRVFAIDTNTGAVTPFAGTGSTIFCGDGAAAVDACLNYPGDITVTPNGDVFIADQSDVADLTAPRHVIRRVDATTQSISTLNCFNGHTPPLDCLEVSSLAAAPDGGLFFSSPGKQIDSSHFTLYTPATAARVSPDLSTVEPAVLDDAGVSIRETLVVTSEGTLVRIVDSRVGSAVGVVVNGAPAVTTSFEGPIQLLGDSAAMPDGRVIITDDTDLRIFDPSTGALSGLAGPERSTFCGDGGAAVGACLAPRPQAIAADAHGTVFVTDTDNHRVRRIDATTGIITTVAGTGTAGNTGDGGPAVAASIDTPRGLAVRPNGDIIISDAVTHTAHVVSATDGRITTIAGRGGAGLCGDGGPARDACLNQPLGVALDSAGNLFIADGGTRVRRLDAVSGVITTVAGTGNERYCGDDAPGTTLCIGGVSSVAVDGNDNLIIADTINRRIRRLDASTGILSTIAGSGFPFESCFQDTCGEGIPARTARLGAPTAVAVQADGGILFVDAPLLRQITPAGVLQTVGYSQSPALAVEASGAVLSLTHDQVFREPVAAPRQDIAPIQRACVEGADDTPGLALGSTRESDGLAIDGTLDATAYPDGGTRGFLRAAARRGAHPRVRQGYGTQDAPCTVTTEIDAARTTCRVSPSRRAPKRLHCGSRRAGFMIQLVSSKTAGTAAVHLRLAATRLGGLVIDPGNVFAVDLRPVGEDTTGFSSLVGIR